MADGALFAVPEHEVAVRPGSGVWVPSSWCHVCLLGCWVVVLFDPPCFFLTSLGCFFWFVFRRLVEFGGEFSAVQADGCYPHPPSPDAHVGGLDVAFAWAEFPAFVSGAVSARAEVVRLKFHPRSTLRAVGFWGWCFFWENKSGRWLVVS